MRHLVYLIENAILNLPEGEEQMSWLIDFTGWTLSTSVPIKTARETVNILQNHYPERLAIAFLYSPPRIFEAFWKVSVLLFILAFSISLNKIITIKGKFHARYRSYHAFKLLGRESSKPSTSRNPVFF